MAPVAPDGADVEQDGLVFGFRSGEGFVSPLVPIHCLVHCRTKIGTCGPGEAVFGFFVHAVPSGALETWPLKDSFVYWIGCCGPLSSGSIGFRPEKPSSWR